MALIHEAKKILKLLAVYISSSKKYEFAIYPQIKPILHKLCNIVDHINIEFVLLHEGRAYECWIELHDKNFAYLKVSDQSFFKHIRIIYKKEQQLIEKFMYYFDFSLCEDAEITQWWHLKLDQKIVGVRVRFGNVLYDIFPEDADKLNLPFSILTLEHTTNETAILKVYKKDGKYVTVEQLDGRITVERFENLNVLKTVLKKLLELIGKEREYFED